MKACVLQPLWATSCQHSHVLLLLHPPGALCTSPSPPSMCIFHSFLQQNLRCAAWMQCQSGLSCLTERYQRIWCWLCRFGPWQKEINYSHISHLCALEATRGVMVRWRGNKASYMWDPQRGLWWMILGLLSQKTSWRGHIICDTLCNLKGIVHRKLKLYH